MKEDIKQLASLWKWCLDNLRPRTRWQFDGPAANDTAVILEVHNIHWEQAASRFDIEFESVSIVGPDGVEHQAAPDGRVPLPNWFVTCQVGPTPLFMPSATFKEYVDAGRMNIMAPGQA